MRIKKIDRYIITEIMPPFLGGLIAFTSIFLMFQTLRLAEFFIVHGIPGKTILIITFNLAISFLPYAMPVSFFIGILVGFGRLSADSELISMKSSGLSLGRISRPIFIVAIGITALSFFLNLELVPWSTRQYWKSILQIGNSKVVSSLSEGTFTGGFFDLLIYAGKIDPLTNEMKNVFIHDARDATTPYVVVAKEGKMVPVRTDQDFGSALVMNLRKGNINRLNSVDRTYQKIDFDEYRLFLEAHGGGDNSEGYKVEMYSRKRLNERINEYPLGDSNRRRYETELWKRYSIALMALTFVWLGVGSGTIRTRSPRSGAALTTLVVVLTYWTSLTYLTTQSLSGLIQPAIAMFIPNLVTLIAGIFLYRKASW